MSWSAHLAILGGCLLLSAYFSGSETGAYSLNRLRLRYRVLIHPDRADTDLMDKEWEAFRDQALF